MKEFPVLHTPRCVMGRITAEEIPVLRQIFDDELTQKYLSELQSLVDTNEGIKRIMASFDTLLKQDEGMIWGIRLGEKLIGIVAFIDLSCKPTIFYATHPSHRSKGYMKECVSQSVQYVLDRGLCSYVQTEVHNDNKTSIRVLQSVGFKMLKKERERTYLQIINV